MTDKLLVHQADVVGAAAPYAPVILPFALLVGAISSAAKKAKANKSAVQLLEGRVLEIAEIVTKLATKLNKGDIDNVKGVVEECNKFIEDFAVKGWKEATEFKASLNKTISLDPTPAF